MVLNGHNGLPQFVKAAHRDCDGKTTVLPYFARMLWGSRFWWCTVLLVLAGCGAPNIIPRYSSVVPPTEHKRVLVVGDLQRTSVLEAWRERNEVQQKMLIRQAAHEALDAVVLLGDQVFWGSSEDD
jgi:hypothetical protein